MAALRFAVAERHTPAHFCQRAPGVDVADHGRGIIRKHTRHGRQIADISVDYAEERDDRGLVRGDAVEVAHPLSSLAV